MSDPRFLLVHGSCHGAWCWDRVLPHLALHPACAIDLPGHGADPTPAAQVTLDLYARAILTAARDMGGPVVLVGHSMAGYPITRAAEIDPTAIARLVYVCAYVPRSGMSLADMRRAGPRQPLRQAIRLAPDGVTFTIDPGQARGVFYHDCSDEDAAFAIPRLGPQPVLPQETPMTVNRPVARAAAALCPLPRRPDDPAGIPGNHDRRLGCGNRQHPALRPFALLRLPPGAGRAADRRGAGGGLMPPVDGGPGLGLAAGDAVRQGAR